MSLRVLVPLDGSKRSQHALEQATGILRGVRPSFTLFTAYSTGFSEGEEDRAQSFDEDPDDELFASPEAAQRMLDEAARRCRSDGIEVETRVGHGGIVDAILEAAQDHDLVVMHALDRSGFKEKLRASAAEKIVRRIERHVLLVAD